MEIKDNMEQLSLPFLAVMENNPELALACIQQGYTLDPYETIQINDRMSPLKGQTINLLEASVLKYVNDDSFEFFKIVFDQWNKDNSENQYNQQETYDFISHIPAISHHIEDRDEAINQLLQYVITPKTYPVLKDKEFDINIKQSVSEDTKQTNILCYLAYNDNIDVLKQIEDQVDNWNIQDSIGQSPVFYALNHENTMDYILGKQVDLDIKNKKGENFLDVLHKKVSNHSKKQSMLKTLKKHKLKNNSKLLKQTSLDNEIIFNVFDHLKNNVFLTQRECNAAFNKVKNNMYIQDMNIHDYKGESLFSRMLRSKHTEIIRTLSDQNIDLFDSTVLKNNQNEWYQSQNLTHLFLKGEKLFIKHNQQNQKRELNLLKQGFFKLLKKNNLIKQSTKIKELEGNKPVLDSVTEVLTQSHINHEIDFIKNGNPQNKSCIDQLKSFKKLNQMFGEDSMYLDMLYRTNLKDIEHYFDCLSENTQIIQNNSSYISNNLFDAINLFRIDHGSVQLSSNPDNKKTNQNLQIVATICAKTLPLYLNSLQNQSQEQATVQLPQDSRREKQWFEETVLKTIQEQNNNYLKETEQTIQTIFDSITRLNQIKNQNNSDNNQSLIQTDQLVNPKLKSIIENHLMKSNTNNKNNNMESQFDSEVKRTSRPRKRAML